MTTIDIVGLNDNTISQMEGGPLARGVGSLDYIKSVKPDIVLALSHPDGRLFEGAHGPIGPVYGMFIDWLSNSGDYEHLGAFSASWVHLHLFLRRSRVDIDSAAIKAKCDLPREKLDYELQTQILHQTSAGPMKRGDQGFHQHEKLATKTRSSVWTLFRDSSSGKARNDA